MSKRAQTTTDAERATSPKRTPPSAFTEDVWENRINPSLAREAIDQPFELRSTAYVRDDCAQLAAKVRCIRHAILAQWDSELMNQLLTKMGPKAVCTAVLNQYSSSEHLTGSEHVLLLQSTTPEVWQFIFAEDHAEELPDTIYPALAFTSARHMLFAPAVWTVLFDHMREKDIAGFVDDFFGCRMCENVMPAWFVKDLLFAAMRHHVLKAHHMFVAWGTPVGIYWREQYPDDEKALLEEMVVEKDLPLHAMIQARWPSEAESRLS